MSHVVTDETYADLHFSVFCCKQLFIVLNKKTAAFLVFSNFTYYNDFYHVVISSSTLLFLSGAKVKCACVYLLLYYFSTMIFYK